MPLPAFKTRKNLTYPKRKKSNVKKSWWLGNWGKQEQFLTKNRVYKAIAKHNSHEAAKFIVLY